MKKLLLAALMMVGISASAQTEVEGYVGVNVNEYEGYTATFSDFGAGISAGDKNTRFGLMVSAQMNLNDVSQAEIVPFANVSLDRYFGPVGIGVRVSSPFKYLLNYAWINPRVSFRLSNKEVGFRSSLVLGYNISSEGYYGANSFSIGLILR